MYLVPLQQQASTALHCATPQAARDGEPDDEGSRLGAANEMPVKLSFTSTIRCVSLAEKAAQLLSCKLPQPYKEKNSACWWRRNAMRAIRFSWNTKQVNENSNFKHKWQLTWAPAPNLHMTYFSNINTQITYLHRRKPGNSSQFPYCQETIFDSRLPQFGKISPKARSVRLRHNKCTLQSGVLDRSQYFYFTPHLTSQPLSESLPSVSQHF